MKQKRIHILLILSLLSTALFATGKQETIDAPDMVKGPILVASKIDTEGALLGNIIRLVLENGGFEVVDKISFGPTDVVRRAIISGEIDIYPDYTGNGAFFFNQSDSELWKDRQKGFEQVKKLDFETNKLVWLTPAPANNTWAICVRQDLAESEGLKSLEDLAAYVNRGGELKLAGSEEFASRPDSLPAFEKAYGFKLENKQLLILAGGNTSQTEQAAARKTEGVNAAMAYGTDGQLAALGLVVLEDSLGVQPVYEPAPIIRSEVYIKYPEIENLLKNVFESLDLVTLQTLNSSIAVEGRNAADVAEEYLKENGFID
ncbi:ABC transporter substrate-binding protein [Oceanispirochaeta sp.]|jgi:osmoprotectant transport system substrate-binding protein|uniref:glycine betaine ABC transporter substrate-binding protein OsmF n=1 Tax=Oceanispirochaeta sp. TaxID=2035350 RepID=UPI00262FE68D|nr:ABC transporter substrate-binding protein [Oceanispirochaeta sp.]MDA3958136.1 ABC transporter substrate-binding protein [Oceanispirochaeta sp.]